MGNDDRGDNMASVKIYFGDALIGVEHFKREFYISESLSGELFWYTGEHPKSGGGVFRIWVQMADTNPRIMTVLPDWQVFIDGQKLESRFYDSIENLGGKAVELRYQEHRFIFHFE